MMSSRETRSKATPALHCVTSHNLSRILRCPHAGILCVWKTFRWSSNCFCELRRRVQMTDAKRIVPEFAKGPGRTPNGSCWQVRATSKQRFCGHTCSHSLWVHS